MTVKHMASITAMILCRFESFILLVFFIKVPYQQTHSLYYSVESGELRVEMDKLMMGLEIRINKA